MAGYKIGKLVYNAYVNSNLSYCSGYWGSAPKRKLNKLYRLQQRAARLITPPYELKSLKDLNIMPLPLAISYRTCTFIHDQITGHGASVLDIKLLGSSRPTRALNNRIIKLERRKSALGSKSHYVKAARIWNSLPANLRTINSRPLFKKRLREYLMLAENERMKYF